MQVKLHKYLFAGTRNIHDLFFERAQKLGFLEFISVLGAKPHLFPEDVQKAKSALKILSKHAKGKQEDETPGHISEIVDQVLAIREKLDLSLEKRRFLQLEMIRVKPFGSFSLDQIHAIEEEGNRYIQFFMIPHDRLPADLTPEELIYLDRVDNIDYFLSVGTEKFFHEGFTEVHIERSYDDLLCEFEALDVEIKEMERIEISLCAYGKMMEEYIFTRMNAINLNFAKEDVDYFVEDKLFMIQAWIPEDRIKDLDELTNGLSIISQKVAIEKEDQPPTYLKNSGFSAMGEDLVYVYDTPATSDKDPSSWVIWFFALFFGMIIADAGYGCLFFSAALFAWFKFGKTFTGIKRRMLKLFTLISLSTIIWGVLIASYFSIQMKPGSFLNKISLPYSLALKKVEFHHQNETELYKEWVEDYPEIENVDPAAQILDQGVKMKGDKKVYELMSSLYDSIFLEISIIIGIIHLSLSFIRNLYRSWFGIGWIMTLIGGYLFFPKILSGHSMAVFTGLIEEQYSHLLGEYLLIGGLILAAVLQMIQQRSVFSIIGTFFKVIEVFADVLSYLRLYALGLASVVLAGTFNDLGPEIGGAVFGPIIILLGHIVNITLGTMAGVIHGLRLNFLEWYHHCYEGGGNKFSPLRLLKRE